jgi:hypothetical protein
MCVCACGPGKQNSWGPNFGEDGYVRFKFGNLCLRGPCQAFIGKPPPS